MEIRDVIEAFKKEIEKLYGKRLNRVILYGSYARWDATEDDIDLLIVVEISRNFGKNLLLSSSV